MIDYRTKDESSCYILVLEGKPRWGLLTKAQEGDWGRNPISRTERVNVAFKELIHRILEKIKHESYFLWPSKISEDPTRKNQNLYCTYHQKKGHTTEHCRTFKNYLE